MLGRVDLSRWPSPRRARPAALRSSLNVAFGCQNQKSMIQILLLDSVNGLGERWARNEAARYLTPWTATQDASYEEGEFFYFFARNSLKRLNSEKLMKTNERNFPFICFRLLAFICGNLASRLYPRAQVGAGLEEHAALAWDRYCEERSDEAIQRTKGVLLSLDCFAALAMTTLVPSNHSTVYGRIFGCGCPPVKNWSK